MKVVLASAGSSHRRRWSRAVVLFLLALGSMALGAGQAQAASITSSGPLTRVEISPDLNCAVNHVSDSAPEFYGDTACGTLLASGGALFGPLNIPAGGGATPRVPFTPVSQSAVTGTGTVADPFKIVTVVDLGTTGLRITETDTYVIGDESYRTDVEVSNSGSSSQDAILYRAGDCFLQSSDIGYGSVDTATGAVACTTDVAPGSRIEQWFPISPGSHYFEAAYSEVWAQIGSQQPFPDTCRCAELIDNGAGLSWNITIPAGSSVTRSHLTTFSPLGRLPLSTSKTADAASSVAGASNGYTISVSNPNASAVTLDSITDTLPPGFTYTPGSTTGATTADPSISGQALTWSGPISVPGASGGNPGTVSLHFNVTVSSTPGDFFNNAGATSTDFSVAPTGDTAPITVTQPQEQADLSLTKSDSPDPVDVGGNLTYTVTVQNGGPQNATGVTVTDPLPANVDFVSATPTQGSCTGTATVTCNLGSIALNGSADITIVVKPTSVGGGTLSNTATVSSASSDANPANDSDTEATQVLPEDTTPTANAGPDQTVNEGTLVTLDGSASSDPDGEALTYAWTAPAGVTLSDPSSATPTFTAPDVSADTLLTFTLQVCDEANPTSLCATDDVVVTDLNVVQPSNISINDVSMNEGNSGTTAFNFTVSMDAAQAAPVTVDFATTDGTATAPSDYTSNSGTLTFAPGETSKTVTVQVNGDTAVEPDETFNVNLSNATANATIADAQGVGTIVNDDQAAAIDAAGDVIVHGPVHASKNGCDHGSKHGWEQEVDPLWPWALIAGHGSEHGSECSKVYLFRVSNLGDSQITVDPNTDIDAVVNVNGTANGSVVSLTGTKTIKPGHSRVFPLRWTSDGTVVAGDTVEFMACVNLAGDVNTANNCDSETRTAVGKHHPDHGHGDEDHRHRRH